MTFLALLLAALVAAALTPVSANVTSRPVFGWPLIGIPLSIGLAGLLAFAINHVTTMTFAAVLAVSSVSAILATQLVVDLFVRRLLRELSYGGLVVFLLAIAGVEPGSASGFKGAIVGAIAMTVITALLVGLSRGALGLGDLHLSPLLGALIGWFSPSAVLLAWMVTAFSAALFTVGGLATKRVSRGAMIPYGPFMILGSCAALLASVAGS